MAPRAGFDAEQVRDKARKDLLHLLEGVSLDVSAMSREEEESGRMKMRAHMQPVRALGCWC
jgi:hypothetical protein